MKTARSATGDRPLRRDVRMLGVELGEALRHHRGDELFERIETVRRLAKRRRKGSARADGKLKRLIASLGAAELEDVIRALTVFFDLANLAEDRHRIRVLRGREGRLHPEPQKGSIAHAIATLARSGVPNERLARLIRDLEVELVFTAHPTEAKRRTVRQTVRRLREDLGTLDRRDLTPTEREELRRRIRSDVSALWATEPVRPRRPTVLEEVRRGLYVAEELWDVVPKLVSSLRSALARHYPGSPFEVRPPVRLGSWIGGDRDGNPSVTPEITARTLDLFRAAAIRRHLEVCRELHDMLTVADRGHPAAADLRRGVADAAGRWPDLRERLVPLHPHEVYRQALAVIRYRLERTPAALDQPPSESGYESAGELVADLRRIARTLRQTGHEFLAEGPVEHWIDQAEVFGFHLARLDVREESRALHDAVAELSRAAGISDRYGELTDDERLELLARPIDEAAARQIDESALGGAARDTLGWSRLLQRVARRFGTAPLGSLVVSMTHCAADLLPLLFLSRLAAACEGEAPVALPFVPLFETIDDLERSGPLLDELLRFEPYRRHLAETGNVQTCMVGYSDSTKDGGYLAASWRIYRAQEELAAIAERHGVVLVLFHGRGGALGRGGGPAARGILSLPPESVRGRIRMTEQGEVLAERYDDPAIALRHLEQVLGATIFVSARARDEVAPDARRLLERAAERSFAAYRALIEDPAFIDYFREASPIEAIEVLNIASRPARRTGKTTLDDLRAIPYTFAWTQNRHLITGFYGLGAGLASLLDDHIVELRAMYRDWPFFRALIHNAELALAKSDLSIAREYQGLAEAGGGAARIAAAIASEHDLARRAVLAITERPALLDAIPWLQRSIEVRNRYVDPLNLIQIELLRRLRGLRGRRRGGDGGDADALERCLRLSIQGIAAGMRTTG